MKSLLVGLFLCWAFPVLTYGQENPDDAFIDEMKKDGYVSIEEAVSQFENNEEIKIELPNIPIESNISLGKAQKGLLSLNWYNTKSTNAKHFKLIIQTTEKKNILNKTNSEKVKLNNGITGYFREDNYYIFCFSKNGITYTYSLDKDSEITRNNFIQIAETFK